MARRFRGGVTICPGCGLFRSPRRAHHHGRNPVRHRRRHRRR